MSDLYRVRIKRGDSEVEIESSDKAYVEEKIREYMDSTVQTPTGVGGSVSPKGAMEGNKQLSLPEFIDRVRPQVDTEYVLAVTYYQEKFEDAESVKSADVVEKLKEVKYKHSNPYYAISRAKKKGLIMNGTEKGTFVATRTGEQWVDDRLKGTVEQS